MSGLALAMSLGATALAACKIQSVEVPVVVTDTRVFIPAEAGGKKAYFVYDTGASFSLLNGGAASVFGMATRENHGLTLYGIGGNTHARSVNFADLKLGQFHLHNQEMLISDHGSTLTAFGVPVVGFVGSDIFGAMDVEFDLAHNVLRLLKPSGCDDDDMVYWGAAYSKAPIVWRSDGGQINLDVDLNGVNLQAILDSGSPVSTVTLGAAARAGVTPQSPGSLAAGRMSGIGGFKSDAWIAEFNAISVGSEKISKAKLMMSDLFGKTTYYELGSRLPKTADTTQMLLGLDFIRSHRLLISRSHEKLYFSYNGGPVFMADVMAARASMTPSSDTAPPAKPPSP